MAADPVRKRSYSNELTHLLPAVRTYYRNGGNHAVFVLDGLDRISRLTCALFSLACKDAVKIAQQWNPGFHGQYSNNVLEATHRIGLIVQFILKFSIGIVPWIIGQTIQTITINARRDFTFVGPSEDVQANMPLPQQLKMVSYNICFGPEWMVAANSVRPRAERIADVTEQIMGYDIVCLQEVFDEDAAEALKESLRANGFHYFIYNVGPSSYKLNSGLFIASKYPLESPVYWKHTHSSGLDSLANKGTLAATVNISGRKFAVFNTHFNAPGIGSEASQQAQMRGLLMQQDAYNREHDIRNNLVALGDFNAKDLSALSGGKLESDYLDLRPHNEEGTLFDLLPRPGNESTGWNKSNLATWAIDRDTGVIDHILLRSTGTLLHQKGTTVIKRMAGASDHLAIEATFSLLDVNFDEHQGIDLKQKIIENPEGEQTFDLLLEDHSS